MASNEQYEVELKFRLNAPEVIRQKIEEMGGVWSAPVEQRDSYFKHPVRDFKKTDEAFRIRSVGEENRITYKGPVIDKNVKTRQEIEVLFASGPFSRVQFSTVLTLLGFEEVRMVKKMRSTATITFNNFGMEFAFDEVAGLGIFLEIETLSNDETRIDAQQAVLTLAAELELDEPERRSYLGMLLEQDFTNK